MLGLNTEATISFRLAGFGVVVRGLLDDQPQTPSCVRENVVPQVVGPPITGYASDLHRPQAERTKTVQD